MYLEMAHLLIVYSDGQYQVPDLIESNDEPISSVLSSKKNISLPSDNLRFLRTTFCKLLPNSMMLKSIVLPRLWPERFAI
ncbi:hypothetical protein BpHYR1_031836 [Brachionus plicatilis]|uniref:Uncharacterized protein n=1 Tax=Brachionus plicatilis TaxID=10195 RepID=A0A3M7SXU3_BRAPC|nr:hypothetical protein BpHYR1_031836 [Brachionus plicatilis]